MGNAWSSKVLDEKKAKGHIIDWKVTSEKASISNDSGELSTKNKYGNRKTVIGDRVFDSKKEAARYLELRMMQRAGLIKDLKLQVPFVLIEPNGKEKGCKYVCDFQYYENGVLIVEDVKSSHTRKLPVYRMKKKLMLERHGIIIKET